MFTFGDILVINFPFSDNNRSKRRPVMVIKQPEDGDILVSKVTSRNYDTEFDVNINDWQASGLLSPSVIRIHKIQTIHTSLVFAPIGNLSSADMKLAKRTLTNLILSL